MFRDCLRTQQISAKVSSETVQRVQTRGGEGPLPWSRCWSQRMRPSWSRLGKGMVEDESVLCKS